MKAEVLEQDDTTAALVSGIDDGLRGVADTIRSERHRAAEELWSAAATGLRLYFGLTWPFGPSEMRGQNYGGALLERIANRRKRRADARIVGDLAVFERDVEVDADEHAPTLQLEVPDRELHSPFFTM